MEESKLLLTNKADANAKGKYKVTPLHFAAAKGYRDIVELLLASKADINAQADFDDKKGLTPLQLAILGGHKDVADILRQHGSMNKHRCFFVSRQLGSVLR